MGMVPNGMVKMIGIRTFGGEHGKDVQEKL